MKFSRKLSLHSESLVELRSDEMSAVAGGTHVSCVCSHDEPCGLTLPVNRCISIEFCTDTTEVHVQSVPC